LLVVCVWSSLSTEVDSIFHEKDSVEPAKFVSQFRILLNPDLKSILMGPLPFEIDISHVTFILAGNQEMTDGPLRTRIPTLTFPALTAGQKTLIYTNQLKQELEQLKGALPTKELQLLSDLLSSEVIALLVTKDSSLFEGVRVGKSVVQSLVHHCFNTILDLKFQHPNVQSAQFHRMIRAALTLSQLSQVIERELSLKKEVLSGNVNNSPGTVSETVPHQLPTSPETSVDQESLAASGNAISTVSASPSTSMMALHSNSQLSMSSPGTDNLKQTDIRAFFKPKGEQEGQHKLTRRQIATEEQSDSKLQILMN